MGHKDYSSTPLWKKLGLAPGCRVLLSGAPDGFRDVLLEGAPEIRLLSRAAGDLDVAVLFVTRLRELTERLPDLVPRMAPAGGLWVAWPKKASGVGSEVDFGAVQAAGLEAGLVDNKSASVTEVFQGLRFVRRLADR
jgi:hypothetical protein